MPSMKPPHLVYIFSGLPFSGSKYFSQSQRSLGISVMQLIPFDKFTQNSFKLFDRGYRPLRPMIATSKIDEVLAAEPGADGKVCCWLISASADVFCS